MREDSRLRLQTSPNAVRDGLLSMGYAGQNVFFTMLFAMTFTPPEKAFWLILLL